jgi:hypothetical protein
MRMKAVQKSSTSNGRSGWISDLPQEPSPRPQIEHVHADVVGAAATGEFPLREPAADAWDAGAAHPHGPGVIDIAEFALHHGLPDGLRAAGEPLVLADHEHAAGFFRGG